jgi:hypothetical protein
LQSSRVWAPRRLRGDIPSLAVGELSTLREVRVWLDGRKGISYRTLSAGTGVVEATAARTARMGRNCILIDLDGDWE